MENKLPTIGFLGSGAITTAMVTGLCERAAGAPYPLVVSDTKAEACEKLRAKFPGRVTAAATLQECVDQSDWIVIAVWPQAGEEVVRSLTFRPEQKIINVMFDKTAEQVASWMNCTPDTIIHMIPGTYLTFYPGPIVMCPSCPEAAEIFGRIGKIVNVESRYQAAVFGTVTSLFAPPLFRDGSRDRLGGVGGRAGGDGNRLRDQHVCGGVPGGLREEPRGGALYGHGEYPRRHQYAGAGASGKGRGVRGLAGGAEADYGAYGGGYSQAFRPLTRSLSKIP